MELSWGVTIVFEFVIIDPVYNRKICMGLVYNFSHNRKEARKESKYAISTNFFFSRSRQDQIEPMRGRMSVFRQELVLK